MAFTKLWLWLSWFSWNSLSWHLFARTPTVNFKKTQPTLFSYLFWGALHLSSQLGHSEFYNKMVKQEEQYVTFTKYCFVIISRDSIWKSEQWNMSTCYQKIQHLYFWKWAQFKQKLREPLLKLFNIKKNPTFRHDYHLPTFLKADILAVWWQNSLIYGCVFFILLFTTTFSVCKKQNNLSPW